MLKPDRAENLGQINASPFLVFASLVPLIVLLVGCSDASAEQQLDVPPEAAHEPTVVPSILATLQENEPPTDRSPAAEMAKSGRSAEGEEVVERAYRMLLSVKSARTAEEWVLDRLGGAVFSPSQAVHDDVHSGKWELTKESNCVEEGTYRACDLVDKESGERVGSTWVAGGRRLKDGIFVPPGTYCYTSTEIYDDVAVNIREDLDAPSKPTHVYQQPWSSSSYRPVFSHLFDRELFDSIEPLADTEMEGTPAVHLRAEYVNAEWQGWVIEWWIAKESELPLFVVQSGERGEHKVRVNYRFSGFDKPVGFPDHLEPIPEPCRVS